MADTNAVTPFTLDRELSFKEIAALYTIGGAAYGPAPWCLGPHVSFAAAIAAEWMPITGDRSLVLFAGIGIENPVLVAGWRGL